jgi:hypothetical protein
MNKVAKITDREKIASKARISPFIKTWEKLDLLPWNPQLLRELKGRFKPINLIVATVISLFSQILIYLYFQAKLDNVLQYNTIESRKGLRLFDRYCLGTPPEKLSNYGYSDNLYEDNYCVTDLLNNWVINWNLWHLDIFVLLGAIATFGLLVVGSYLLVADLAKEESTGTFNFIRLGDRSANSIFVGKIFGVPSLLYFVFLLAVPFHLFVGISAGIPISLILGFYTILGASCFCCYSLAILFGLANFGMTNFKAFVVSGGILGIVFFMTNIWFYRYFGSSQITQSGFDWWSLVYPNAFLTYLVDSSNLPEKIVNYLPIANLNKLHFYGLPIGDRVETFFTASMMNYALCIYWIWQGIERKFRDNTATFINKKQSYLLTLSVCFVFQGLTLQEIDSEMMESYYLVLQLIITCFCLGLMLMLSPSRQNLYDWARYRHLNQRSNRSLWQDLIWGEKSPATLAFAIDLFIIFAYTSPAIFIFIEKGDRVPFLLGTIVSLSVALIYASIVQLMFLLNTKRRGILALATILSLAILPFVILGIFGVSSNEMPLAWLFTFLPSVSLTSHEITSILGTIALAFLGQLSIIGFCNLQISQQIKKAALASGN